MLDDKRKTPCCLMAAWGFAMVGMPDQVGHDGRAGDDVEELAGEVFGDGFYVGVDDGLFAGSALDVLEVVGIVHELGHGLYLAEKLDMLTPVALFGFIGAQVLAKMGKTEDLESTCGIFCHKKGTGPSKNE